MAITTLPSGIRVAADPEKGSHSEALAQALAQLLGPLKLAGQLVLRGIDEPRLSHLCRRGDGLFREEVCYLRIQEAPPKKKVDKSVRIGGGYYSAESKRHVPVVAVAGLGGDRRDTSAAQVAEGLASAVESASETPNYAVCGDMIPNNLWGDGAVPSDRFRIRDPVYAFGAYTRGESRFKHGDRMYLGQSPGQDGIAPGPAVGAFRVLTSEKQPWHKYFPPPPPLPEPDCPEGISTAGAAEALDAMLRALGLEATDESPLRPQIYRTELPVGDRWSVELCYICADAARDRPVDRIVERPVDRIIERIVEVEKIVDRIVVVEKEVEVWVDKIVKVEVEVERKRPRMADSAAQTDLSFPRDFPEVSAPKPAPDPRGAMRIGGGFAGAPVVPGLADGDLDCFRACVAIAASQLARNFSDVGRPSPAGAEQRNTGHRGGVTVADAQPLMSVGARQGGIHGAIEVVADLRQATTAEASSPCRTTRGERSAAAGDDFDWDALASPNGFLVGSFARGSAVKQRFTGTKTPRTLFRVYRSGSAPESAQEGRSSSCPKLVNTGSVTTVKQCRRPQADAQAQVALKEVLTEIRKRRKIAFDEQTGIAIPMEGIRYKARHYGADFVEEPTAEFEAPRVAQGTLRDVVRLISLYRSDADVVAFVPKISGEEDEERRAWLRDLASRRARLVVRALEELGAPKGRLRTKVEEQSGGSGLDMCFCIDVASSPLAVSDAAIAGTAGCARGQRPPEGSGKEAGCAQMLPECGSPCLALRRRMATSCSKRKLAAALESVPEPTANGNGTTSEDLEPAT